MFYSLASRQVSNNPDPEVMIIGFSIVFIALSLSAAAETVAPVLQIKVPLWKNKLVKMWQGIRNRIFSKSPKPMRASVRI